MDDPGYTPFHKDMPFNTVYFKIYESAKHGGVTARGLFWQLLSLDMDSFKDGYEIILDGNSITNLIT